MVFVGQQKSHINVRYIQNARIRKVEFLRLRQDSLSRYKGSWQFLRYWTFAGGNQLQISSRAANSH